MFGAIRLSAGFAAWVAFTIDSTAPVSAFAPTIRKTTAVARAQTIHGPNSKIPTGCPRRDHHDASNPNAFARGSTSPSNYDATRLSAFLDDGAMTFNMASDLLSNENIKTAFSVATFLPQIFWVFLILLPNWGFTKKLMGGYEVVTLCCLVHFFIVSASIVQPDGSAPIAEFADVFDPAGDPQKAMVGMMTYPNFVSEEWSHVLTWDLFVGRWIWMDGLRRGVFTPHSVLLCNLIGPPGLLLHWATCIVTGKGIAPNEAEDLDEDN